MKERASDLIFHPQKVADESERKRASNLIFHPQEAVLQQQEGVPTCDELTSGNGIPLLLCVCVLCVLCVVCECCVCVNVLCGVVIHCMLQ
jgi:hypothetical protein